MDDQASFAGSEMGNAAVNAPAEDRSEGSASTADSAAFRQSLVRVLEGKNCSSAENHSNFGWI